MASIVTGIPAVPAGGFLFTVSEQAQTTSNVTVRDCIIAAPASGSGLQLGVPFLATGVQQVVAAAGVPATENEPAVTASDIGDMYTRYRSINPSTECWVLPVTVVNGVPTKLATELQGLGDKAFSTFMSPFSDVASVGVMDAFLNDVTGRWNYVNQTFGHHITASTQNVQGLENLGNELNTRYNSVFGMTGSTDSQAEIAAAYGARISLAMASNPVGSPNGYSLDIAAPAFANQFTFATRNGLLSAGISCAQVDDAGDVTISGARTTYKTDADGNPDSTWSRVTTMYNLASVIQQFRSGLSIFTTGHYAVVPDGSQLFTGSKTTTPGNTLGYAISLYNNLAAAGQVTNTAAFAANAQAEISADGYGINLYLPLYLPGELDALYVAFAVAVA